MAYKKKQPVNIAWTYHFGRKMENSIQTAYKAKLTTCRQPSRPLANNSTCAKTACVNRLSILIWVIIGWANICWLRE